MEQAGGGLGPDFIGGVKNVTVPEGRDVVLSCSVEAGFSQGDDNKQ